MPRTTTPPSSSGLQRPASFCPYHDRWRCIEAFSSRFCFGSGYLVLITAHLCMLWVPTIAFLYANYRGLRKLLGS